MEESIEDARTVDGLTDSQQSMIRFDQVSPESVKFAKTTASTDPAVITLSSCYSKCQESAEQNHSRSHSPDHDLATSDEPIVYFLGQQQKGSFSSTDGRSYGYHTYFNPQGFLPKSPVP
ncbi:hypothetical protein WJX77_012235 [Trebouxia sp. C0004]